MILTGGDLNGHVGVGDDECDRVHFGPLTLI